MQIRRLTLLVGASSSLLLLGWQTAEVHGQTQAAARATHARYVQLEFAPASDEPVGETTAESLLARSRADLATAAQLDHDTNSHCVDLYFWTAVRLWSLMAQTCGPVSSGEMAEAEQLYEQALAQLIDAGLRFRRLDPKSHLAIEDGRARRIVPITLHRLPWEPEDFCKLLPAKSFRSHRLTVHYATPGVGVCLVAVRVGNADEPKDSRRKPFAVTAVLRPAADSTPEGLGGGSPDAPPAALEFYNPLSVDTVDVGGEAVPLARDLSAPLVFAAEDIPQLNLQGFLMPDDSDVQPEMQMLEPYQRGKIPVVFIHGLLSDPMAWLNAANELRAQPDIYRRFQFWAYRYPTGGDVLNSAAALREYLRSARQEFDPEQSDPTLDDMVLITHSLGGLMGTLQITDSQDILWRSIAREPLPAIKTSEQVRAQLARSYFFEPVASVRRVVFLGTPFKGSSWANRSIGRISSDLVRFGSQVEAEHAQLIEQNRDAFATFVRRSWPTTIDLLEPSNPMLQAIGQLPINEGVHLHTIVGTGTFRIVREPSDGVVPVTSARHAGVDSEIYVPAWHSGLHNDQQSLNELKRILRLHAREADGGQEEFAPIADRPASSDTASSEAAAGQ